MGGEPYTWRRVSTVRRQAVGNLPPKGGTAPTAEPTGQFRKNKAGYAEDSTADRTRFHLKIIAYGTQYIQDIVLH